MISTNLSNPPPGLTTKTRFLSQKKFQWKIHHFSLIWWTYTKKVNYNFEMKRYFSEIWKSCAEELEVLRKAYFPLAVTRSTLASVAVWPPPVWVIIQNIYIFNPLPSKYYFSRENISEVSILMMVDRWGWGSQLIPVLNFGYFPQQINDEINIITEEFLTMVDRLFWQTRSNFPHCRIWTW